MYYKGINFVSLNLSTKISEHLTMNTFNLLFYLRTDRKKDDSLYPIYMRITVDGKRTELSTKRFINRDNWDSKANKATGYKGEVKQLNQFLESLRTLMNDYHTEMVKMGEEITAQSLKNKFLGISENRRMLIKVFEYHNHQLKELEGTNYASAAIKRYTTTLNHIKAFLVFKYQLNDSSKPFKIFFHYRPGTLFQSNQKVQP